MNVWPKTFEELSTRERNHPNVVKAPREYGGLYWYIYGFNSRPWLSGSPPPELPNRIKLFQSVYGPKTKYELFHAIPGGVGFWPTYSSVYDQEERNFIAKEVPDGVKEDYFNKILYWFVQWNMTFMCCYTSYMYSGPICIFNGAIDPLAFSHGERVTQSAKNVFSTTDGPRNTIVTLYQIQLIKAGIAPENMHPGTDLQEVANITPEHVPEMEILVPLIDNLPDEIKNGKQFD